MNLESVELVNWKQHAHKLIEFDEKATVLYGPNETGKSTVFEALHRGFFDRHNSTSAEIRKIQPITATGKVSSSVRITFSVGEERYLLEKTFNNNAESNISRLDDGKQLIAQGNHADQYVLDLLEAEMQKGRSSDPSKWGVFYWLWTSQDKRELPKDGDVGALKLDQVEGNVMITPKLDKVRQRFDKIYLEYFTEKRGQRSSSSPLTEIIDKLENLEIEVAGLNLKLSTVEKYKQDLNSRLVDLPDLIDGLEKSKEEYRGAIEESRDYVKIEAELETSKAKIREIQGVLGEANDALNRLKAAANRIEELRSEEGELQDQLIQAEVRVQRIEEDQVKITERIDDKTDELGKIDELLADVRAQYTIRQNRENLEIVSAKINEIEEIENKVQELQSGLRELLITEDELLELEKDEATLRVKKQTLEDTGLKIERVAGSKGSLDVKLDGSSMGNDSGTAVSEVVVFHDGYGEVLIQADIEKAQDTQRDIGILSNRIGDTLQSNKVKSIHELRTFFSENQRIENEIATLSARRSGIDSKSVDSLRSELKVHEEKAAEYSTIERSEYSVTNNPLDDSLGSLVVQRENERRDAESKLGELREERDGVRGELEDSRAQRTKLSVSRDALRSQIRGLEKDQQELISRFGSEKIQSDRIREETERLNAEIETKDELERQYEEFKEGPLATIHRLENSIRNQEELIQNHRATIEQLRGHINENSLDGTYSRLSRIESKIESLKERRERESVKADAIKLLKNVMETQYNANLEAITEPVKRDIAEYLAYVTGNLHEDVELDDNLFPVRLGERGVSELALDYEDGSSGLREALGLCVRLAIAKSLSSFEHQCLVLDDPFVHVSTDRSMRMIELINRIVDETGLQIVILTHRPAEFTGFSGKMIDIQS